MTDRDTIYKVLCQANSLTNFPWCPINNNNNNKLDRMSCLSRTQEDDPCTAQQEEKYAQLILSFISFFSAKT
jgi:hypothetical protein